MQTVTVGQRVFWNDPDRGLGSGPGTVTRINSDGEPDDETVITLNMDSGSEAEVLLHELVAGDYELTNPNEHTFVRVPKQTGCARCGYHAGQHPSRANLKAQTKADIATALLKAGTFPSELAGYAAVAAAAELVAHWKDCERDGNPLRADQQEGDLNDVIACLRAWFAERGNDGNREA